MVWLFRAIGGLIRTVFIMVLVVVVLLVGLAYLDGSGIAEGRVRGVLADTISPGVAELAQGPGGTLAEQIADALRSLLSRADQVLAQQGVLAAPTLPAGAEPAADQLADSRAVLELINQYRAREGLRPWRWDGRLATFAQTRADDMISRNYFSHNDPATGQIKLADLPTLVSIGENLFQVSGPAVRFMRNVNEEVVTGWQNSPSHNQLLLADKMTRGGVAFARTDTRIIVVLIAAE
jgi:uncharacterized protein YkwD